MKSKISIVTTVLIIGALLFVGTAFANDERGYLGFGKGYGMMGGGMKSGGMMGGGMKSGGMMGNEAGSMHNFIAEYLEMDPFEIREYHRAGLSMVQIAEEAGVTAEQLIDAVVEYKENNPVASCVLLDEENIRERVTEMLNVEPGQRGMRGGGFGGGCGATIDGQFSEREAGNFRGQGRGMQRL
ncbi:hypothetical protein [Desulfuribacillus alkaliarsenatis]|uniref:Uncharacterized protein n=1 Tax=Desulfuribacillus alkaliarsenatis TaxID=766136 RepID=A0A1E5G0V2_9FIRM|nr:hypothetical protein [Desulfuribacillus alkaliarsenatis]OEF96535.1 hypothetical protein BHF68_07740 [Desulfuribacillus alkaliarsenatis]